MITALSRAGFDVDLVGASKFEDFLGQHARARVFGAAVGVSPARVDILFLDDPLDDLRVCVTPALDFDVFASGQRIARGGSSAEIFFAVSQRVFALASDRRARDALRDAFGLWEPRC